MTSMIQSPAVVSSEGVPVNQVYDTGSGTFVAVSAGTVNTDSNHNSQKSAPLSVQLAAGSVTVGDVQLVAGTALVGGVNIIDSAGTNKAGVGAGHEVYVSDGGTGVVSITASSAGAVKAAAGRLCKVVVLTTVTSAVSIYDNTNAASGTVLLTIPTTAAVGTIYSPQLPLANGAYVGGGAGSPALAVSYL